MAWSTWCLFLADYALLVGFFLNSIALNQNGILQVIEECKILLKLLQ